MKTDLDKFYEHFDNSVIKVLKKVATVGQPETDADRKIREAEELLKKLKDDKNGSSSAK